MSMIDLHCHVLVGVDDGAADFETACAMLDEAQRNEIDIIVTTPHFHAEYSNEVLDKKMCELAEAAKERNIRLLAGMEYNYRDIREWNPERTKRPLGNVPGGYLLLDFRMPLRSPHVAMELLEFAGTEYRLVLAHPERTFDETMWEQLQLFRDEGISFQVTAASVCGVFGRQVQRFTFRLLEQHMVQLLGSDAHNTSGRRNYLGEAYHEIAKRYGNEAALQLRKNAEAVLQGQPLSQLKLKERKLSLRRYLQNILHWGKGE